MNVRITIGAEAAYASITHNELSMDVRLEPGRSAARSLRETAKEWNEKARHLQKRASVLFAAATELEDPSDTSSVKSPCDTSQC